MTCEVHALHDVERTNRLVVASQDQLCERLRDVFLIAEGLPDADTVRELAAELRGLRQAVEALTAVARGG